MDNAVATAPSAVTKTPLRPLTRRAGRSNQRRNALMRWLCWQMPYHTAHHTFPSVPFWKLRDLNEKIEDKVGEVWRMGWIEFQIEVIGKLRQKDESQYPMNEVWVLPVRGRQVRILAE